jgi:hypothetical protein
MFADNIFLIMHRLCLLHAQGVKDPMKLDTTSTAYKLYKDFTTPPLPPAFEHLNLPSHWLIHMFASSTKRTHKKAFGNVSMSFKQLARDTAEAYKKIDSTTKTWLDEISKKLFLHNRAQQNALWRFIKKQREAEELEEERAKAKEETEKEKAAASMSALASVPQRSSGNQVSTARSRERLSSVAFATAPDQMLQHLQTMQMQALGLGAVNPHLGMPPSMLPVSALGGVFPNSSLQAKSSRQSPKRQRDEDENSLSNGSKRAEREPLPIELTELWARDQLLMGQMASIQGPTLAFGSPSLASLAPVLPFAAIASAELPNLVHMRAMAFEESAARGDQIIAGYRLGVMAAARVAAAASAAASSDRVPESSEFDST